MNECLSFKTATIIELWTFHCTLYLGGLTIYSLLQRRTERLKHPLQTSGRMSKRKLLKKYNECFNVTTFERCFYLACTTLKVQRWRPVRQLRHFPVLLHTRKLLSRRVGRWLEEVAIRAGDRNSCEKGEHRFATRTEVWKHQLESTRGGHRIPLISLW